MSIAFMCKGYSIIADVQEVRDAYGTGDSPTLYEVDLLQIINDDLEEIEESDLGKFFYDEIIDAAIQSYRSWFNDN